MTNSDTEIILSNNATFFELDWHIQNILRGDSFQFDDDERYLTPVPSLFVRKITSASIHGTDIDDQNARAASGIEG